LKIIAKKASSWCVRVSTFIRNSRQVKELEEEEEEVEEEEEEEGRSVLDKAAEAAEDVLGEKPR
jgi:hypothetical protein